MRGSGKWVEALTTSLVLHRVEVEVRLLLALGAELQREALPLLLGEVDRERVVHGRLRVQDRLGHERISTTIDTYAT